VLVEDVAVDDAEAAGGVAARFPPGVTGDWLDSPAGPQAATSRLTANPIACVRLPDRVVGGGPDAWAMSGCPGKLMIG
jgi:hypothetical protein